MAKNKYCNLRHIKNYIGKERKREREKKKSEKKNKLQRHVIIECKLEGKETLCISENKRGIILLLRWLCYCCSLCRRSRHWLSLCAHIIVVTSKKIKKKYIYILK